MRITRRFRLALAAAAVVLTAARGVGAQEVLLTQEQALKEIFPEAARTTVERRRLDGSTARRIEEQLGRRLHQDDLEVTKVFDAGGAFRGYAVVTEEVGKYRPITFMVGVTPAFTVRDVAVMVYRESRGGEVRRKRFLAQYRGKSERDAIALNRDIINISGATISVRSLNAGVKRVLAELSAVYGTTTAASR